MLPGYDGTLYVLAFDHRGSFQKAFFGVTGDLTPEEATKIVDAKKVIFEGFQQALAQGGPVASAGGHGNGSQPGSGQAIGESSKTTTTTTTSTSAPPPAASTGSASGAQLNDQGYALIQAGSYDEAVAVLRRAVASFPKGTSDLNYAYALYNLGHALRLAGRPEKAIPILEERLQIPNQAATVRQELAAARAEVPGAKQGKKKKKKE